MDPELIFTISGRLVMPAWLLLIFLPRWKWTEKLVFYVWIPSIIAVFYIYLMSTALPFSEGAGFGSVKAVMNLFTIPAVAAAGWIHYLAFDLFVGAWEVRDAQRRNVNHLLVVPCLMLTLMAGPAGLLLYFVIRYLFVRELSTVETA